MEALFAYVYLWMLGLTDEKQYCDYLDELFLNSSKDNLLLDLECCTDAKSAFERLKRYFDYETSQFDADLFGKTLFCGLNKNYLVTDIELFVAKCYELYNLLPAAVERFEEPFHTLCYIDDVLELNGLQETKNRIEKMLSFYEY